MYILLRHRGVFFVFAFKRQPTHTRTNTRTQTMAVSALNGMGPSYHRFDDFGENPRPAKAHRFTGGVVEHPPPPKFGIPSRHVTHDGSRTVHEVQSSLATLSVAQIDPELIRTYNAVVSTSSITPHLIFSDMEQDKAATAERLLMFVCTSSKRSQYFNSRGKSRVSGPGTPTCLPLVSLAMINRQLECLKQNGLNFRQDSECLKKLNGLFTLRGPNISYLKKGGMGFSGATRGSAQRLMVNSYVGGLQRHADCFVRSCADKAPFAGCELYLVWYHPSTHNAVPKLVPLLDVGEVQFAHPQFGSTTPRETSYLRDLRATWSAFKAGGFTANCKMALMARVGQITEYGTMPSAEYELKSFRALESDDECASANAIGVQT